MFYLEFSNVHHTLYVSHILLIFVVVYNENYICTEHRIVKNGQSRNTGKIGYKNKAKTQRNLCFGHLYAEACTNNVNKI